MLIRNVKTLVLNCDYLYNIPGAPPPLGCNNTFDFIYPANCSICSKNRNKPESTVGH